MNGIEIAIDPRAIDLGWISLHWYGLMIAVALGVSILFAIREARRLGISEDAIVGCAFWSILTALAGARLFHIVDRLDFYLQNPQLMLTGSQAGLAIWGGLLVGSTVGLFYARVTRTPVGKLADAVAPAMLLGLIVGRLGCLINGDAYGAPVDLPFGLVYLHADAMIPDLGITTHAYPLYEVLWNGIVFTLVWWLRTRQLPSGMLFLTAAILYSLGRFVLTFLRLEVTVLAGLQQAQVLGLATIAVCTVLLIVNLRSAQGRPRIG